jgi:hypothetical protein
MRYDTLVENYLETLLEGRPKTDHDKEISLDFDDIESYITKMSDDNLNKPIYNKILEILKSDNEENRFTVSKIKNIIEKNLKQNFDNKKSVEFNAKEFINLFMNQRKSYSPFVDSDEDKSNDEETSESESTFSFNDSDSDNSSESEYDNESSSFEQNNF